MKIYHTLFMKLFVSFFILSALLLLFTGWITYQNAAHSLNQQLNTEAQSTFNRNFKVLSLYLSDLKRMGDAAAVNPAVSDFLKNKNEDAYYSFFPKLDDVMSSIHTIRPENVGITIVSESGFLYYYGYSFNRGLPQFMNYPWLPSQEIIRKGSYITSVHSRPYNNFTDKHPVFSYVQQLYSADLRAKGLLIIDFELDALNNLFSADSAAVQNDLEELVQFFVQDQQGQLVYPNDPQHAMPGNLEKYERVQRLEPATGWTMSAYFLENKWFEPVNHFRTMFLNVIISSLLIGLIASFIISTRFSQPIKQLRLLMKEVEKGNFNQQFEVTRKDEIGQLGAGFNTMVKKIKELIELVYIEQNHKRRAEVAALQAQINPHFLYNTLESINSMARKSKEPNISKMIVLLGKLFRISISKFEEMVPFSKEFEYLKLYLEIHKLRLTKQIDYFIDVDPNIYPLYTVK